MKPKQTLKRTSAGWRVQPKPRQPSEQVETLKVVPGVVIKTAGSGSNPLAEGLSIVAAKPVAIIDASKKKINPAKPSFELQPVDTKAEVFKLMSQAFQGKGVKALKRI